MDPVSVLGIVSGATTVAELLGTTAINLTLFIKDVRGVNETVEGLHRDVLGLEQALNSVKRLANAAPAGALQSLDEQEYLALLSSSIKSCETIAQTLDIKISKLVPSRRLSNPFAKAKLQIHILLAEDEIKELRIQADCAKQNILTALQLLQMSSTRRSEDTLDIVREEVFRLTAMVIDMRRFREKVNTGSQSHSAATGKALQENQQLVKSAQQALSVVGSTVAGSTTGDDIASIVFAWPEKSEASERTSTEEWVRDNSTAKTLKSLEENTRQTESVTATIGHEQTFHNTQRLNSLETALLSIRDNEYISAKIMDKMITESRFVVKSKDVQAALNDAICLASFKGDITSVKGILRYGASPNARSPHCNNATALIQAVKGNHAPTVRYLLRHGSDVDEIMVGDLHSYLKGTSQISGTSLQFPAWAEYTAISYAAALGHVSVMKLLMDHEADINQFQAETSMSPIHLAAYEGHANIVDILLRAGAVPERSIHPKEAEIDAGICHRHFVHIAAQQGHYQILKIWESFLADNRPASIYQHPPGRFEPEYYYLHLPGTAFTVHNRERYFKGSPFHAIATISPSCSGLQEIIELLIDWGLDINDGDGTRDGWTPLQVAVECQNPEAVRLLLRYGADVNERSEAGYTAMHCVVMSEKDDKKSMNDSLSILRILLEDGGDPNLTVRPDYTGSYGTPAQVRRAKIDADGRFGHKWYSGSWDRKFTKEAEKIIKQYILTTS